MVKLQKNTPPPSKNFIWVLLEVYPNQKPNIKEMKSTKLGSMDDKVEKPTESLPLYKNNLNLQREEDL